jgi:NAD+ diphosphatase
VTGDASLDALGPAPTDLDRAAHRRTDEAWLERCWSSGTALVVTFDDTGVVIPGPDGGVVAAAAVDAPRPPVFLGVRPTGEGVFATLPPREADDPRAASAPPGSRSLRALLSGLDLEQSRIAAYATALARWHERHAFCPRCGGQTRVRSAGHVRRCLVCESDHYPRTDSAVIVLVTDGTGRALLGRQHGWPAGRFSTLAGFVEPGESLEAAVAREVFEESGVTVSGITYVASQPWPFPASLMLGFFAQADGVDITVDGVELEEASWFTRAALTEAVTDGKVVLPPSTSISRRLIDAWHGGPLGEADFL